MRNNRPGKTNKSLKAMSSLAPPKKTRQAVTGLSADLARQNRYVDRLKSHGERGFSLIAADAFIRGMRDSGYRSTATAIDEFIDNSIQAGARRIDVAFTLDRSEGKAAISNIMVIDDGHGMVPEMIRAAVLWGGTHRENDRTGFGRYGFGLPSAAVSITPQFEVLSRVRGGKWHKVRISLDDVSSGKLTDRHGRVLAPPAKLTALPKFIKDHLGKWNLEQGTVVVLELPDRLSPGFRSPSSFQRNMIEHIGLVYRGMLNECSIYVNERKVEPIDPLFLDTVARFYDVGNGIFAEGLDPLEIELATNKGRTGVIRFRFSYMHPKFQVGPGEEKNNERLAVMKDNQAYFIVTRAGRQIDLVTRPRFSKDDDNVTLVNFDRNWAIELDFDPTLDEEFGITTNKQQVTISDRLWQVFEEHSIPTVVKSLRAKFSKARKDLKAEDYKTDHQPTNSEIVMAEAEKFRPKLVIPKPKEKKAQERLIQEAEEKAQQTQRPTDEHIKELLAEIKSRPYKIEFESLEGAPFYRMEQFGTQKRLYINTRHRFYTDLYDAPESSPRVRTALELLLFTIGVTEMESSNERELFYQTERGEWSRRLDLTLALLDKKDSIQDAESAHTEDEEIAAMA
jgi:Txe/YoeB family toxin of Txe-Axe toxin-antitoxin module